MPKTSSPGSAGYVIAGSTFQVGFDDDGSVEVRTSAASSVVAHTGSVVPKQDSPVRCDPPSGISVTPSSSV